MSNTRRTRPIERPNEKALEDRENMTAKEDNSEEKESRGRRRGMMKQKRRRKEHED